MIPLSSYSFQNLAIIKTNNLRHPRTRAYSPVPTLENYIRLSSIGSILTFYKKFNRLNQLGRRPYNFFAAREFSHSLRFVIKMFLFFCYTGLILITGHCKVLFHDQNVLINNLIKRQPVHFKDTGLLWASLVLYLKQYETSVVSYFFMLY